MTSLEPRRPADSVTIARQYPPPLELQQVQILLRHGERAPNSDIFKEHGLNTGSSWPYCDAAKNMRAAILSADGSWDTLMWKRKLETLGRGDAPGIVTRDGKENGMCVPGELTAKGRRSTLALGERARDLYVTHLGFLPERLDENSKSQIWLRSTPRERTMESIQQVLQGLYPPGTRSPSLAMSISTRLFSQETLTPNNSACRRLAELDAAFSKRAASIWNQSHEMNFINKKLQKWMPTSSPVVAVDSDPPLSSIMEAVNAALAQGVPLPSELHDKDLLDHIDRICVDEWFAGYHESKEFRKLGIGSLLGDVAQRMVERTGIGGEMSPKPFKFSVSGCHDTTIGAVLASLGVLTGNNKTWPKFTSSIALELFKSKEAPSMMPSKAIPSLMQEPSPNISSRQSLQDLPPVMRRHLDAYYVRVRYNDDPVTLPICKLQGNHLAGDETFCTLTAFKSATDAMTPKDWKSECQKNLGAPEIPANSEPPPGVESH